MPLQSLWLCSALTGSSVSSSFSRSSARSSSTTQSAMMLFSEHSLFRTWTSLSFAARRMTLARATRTVRPPSIGCCASRIITSPCIMGTVRASRYLCMTVLECVTNRTIGSMHRLLDHNGGKVSNMAHSTSGFVPIAAIQLSFRVTAFAVEVVIDMSH